MQHLNASSRGTPNTGYVTDRFVYIVAEFMPSNTWTWNDKKQNKKFFLPLSPGTKYADIGLKWSEWRQVQGLLHLVLI